MNNTHNATQCDAHHGGYFSTALADGGYRVCRKVLLEFPRMPSGCAVFLRA